jgi:hypothetical protein
LIIPKKKNLILFGAWGGEKYLDNPNHKIKKFNKKSNKYFNDKPTKYLYAHNGKGFDAYLILHDKYIQQNPKMSFTNTIKNDSGIM